MKRRVVVTGLGLVTPLGINVNTVWSRLLKAESGIVNVDFQTPSKVAAIISATDLELVRVDKQQSQFIQYAMYAAHAALTDAQWFPQHCLRTGVCIGSGIGSLEEIITAHTTLQNGMKRLSPFFVPRLLINLAAGRVSIKYGFMGPNHAVSTACTTGAHSIGDASRFIEYGDADVMVTGGTEASISPLSMAGFAKLRALSTEFNDCPEQASRPFDKSRDGFVIGEGAGIVVLEELEHAKKRGAKIYAEVGGYGLSGDAYHITSPPSDGSGAARAMKRAMEIANISPEQVDYVNAHATSTPLGDVVECKAIHSALGQDVYVSSTKGSIGHLLGAAGAVESIFAILSVYTNQIPLTRNLETIDEEVNIVKHVKESLDLSSTKRRCGSGTGVHVALSNSFGFGGTNASLLFKKYIL